MAFRGDESEIMNLREWDRRARLIRENPTSRRFSASYIGSFREDHHKSSCRTNFNNISSTASSPGYNTLKEEIDPSTYSFTNAIKALQAKTMYNNREWLAQEGFALNSKWNEAEKYICNPLSGEVPMECLSAKTLSARSFRNLSTMSAPLHFPSPLMTSGQNKPNNINPNVRVIHEDLYAPDPILLLARAEKKVVGLKRDVGIQSTTSVDFSSGSPSPAKTPPIMERSLKRHVEADDSPVDFNLKLEGQQEDVTLEEKEKEEEKQYMSKEEGEEEEEDEEDKEVKQEEMSEEDEEEEEKTKKKKKRGTGCFSWVRSRQRQARKSKYIFPVCVPHLVKGC
ncbi:PREDICTED: myb-like protein P isoform X2 [Camelina sativa]|uniref:Myb-like protein P isoform X2 n=1 Tax=Camelina sativa TaxID=90675 RepID=A0ABM0VBI8_CAMSA|nr:PREDICTED: myb-like protein P isoform X2 [Camelina sativa]